MMEEFMAAVTWQALALAVVAGLTLILFVGVLGGAFVRLCWGPAECDKAAQEKTRARTLELVREAVRQEKVSLEVMRVMVRDELAAHRRAPLETRQECEDERNIQGRCLSEVGCRTKQECRNRIDAHGECGKEKPAS